MDETITIAVDGCSREAIKQLLYELGYCWVNGASLLSRSDAPVGAFRFVVRLEKGNVVWGVDPRKVNNCDYDFRGMDLTKGA